jgi:hypothetical protein
MLLVPPGQYRVFICFGEFRKSLVQTWGLRSKKLTEADCIVLFEINEQRKVM